MEYVAEISAWIDKTYGSGAFNSIGAIASVTGVVISVIGFSFTIFNVIKSKSAATRAEIAAKNAQDSANFFDSVASMSRAISIMDEIKRLNRANEWKVVLDRISEAKRALVEVKNISPELADEDVNSVQGTIGQLAAIEDIIEKAIRANQGPDDVPRINEIIAQENDELHTILIHLKAQQGR